MQFWQLLPTKLAFSLLNLVSGGSGGCAFDEYWCRFEGVSICIAHNLTCNGENDCGNFEDEMGCQSECFDDEVRNFVIVKCFQLKNNNLTEWLQHTFCKLEPCPTAIVHRMYTL